MPTAQKTTEYGDPVIVQRTSLWLGRNRPAWLRALRCRLGKHNPPVDTAFSIGGATHVGGSCTRCDYEQWVPICWIGNDWDFPGVATQIKTDQRTSYHVDPLALYEVLGSLGFRYIGSVGF